MRILGFLSVVANPLSLAICSHFLSRPAQCQAAFSPPFSLKWVQRLSQGSSSSADPPRQTSALGKCSFQRALRASPNEKWAHQNQVDGCWASRDASRKAVGEDLVRYLCTSTDPKDGDFLNAILESPPLEPGAMKALSAVKMRCREALVMRHGSGNLVPDSLLGERIAVPHVGRHGCQLCGSGSGEAFRLQNMELERFLIEMFKAVAEGCTRIGIPTRLSQYDLHHGHVFYSIQEDACGILFHLKEYPKFDEESFPYHLGFCQEGSNVADVDHGRRNVLWMQSGVLPQGGILSVLRTKKGSVLGETLVFEGQEELGTVWEGDLGLVCADLVYMDDSGGFDVRQATGGFQVLGPTLMVNPYPVMVGPGAIAGLLSS